MVMQYFRNLLLLGSMAIVLHGCSSSPKYYKEIVGNNFMKTFHGAEVDLGVFVQKPSSSTKTKTAFDLPERALKEYIEKIDGTPAEIRSALVTPMKAPSSASDDKSGINHSKKITFTVSGTGLQPADRIIQAKISSGLEPGWRFKGWNAKQIKENQTIASVERTSELTLSAESVLDLGLDELVDPVLSPSTSRSEKYNQDLNYSLLSYLPILQPESMNIHLEALFPQISATGIYEIQLNLEYVENPMPQTIIDVNYNKDKTKANISRRQMYYVPMSHTRDVRMNSRLDYVLRHVVNGHNTLEERDDRVVYLKCIRKDECTNSSKKISETVLIDKRDLHRKVHGIKIGGKPIHIWSSKIHPACQNGKCLFNLEYLTQSDDSAAKFLNWVKEKPHQRLNHKSSTVSLFKLLKENASGDYVLVTPTEIESAQVSLTTLNYKIGEK